jgi:hypothetical protein
MKEGVENKMSNTLTNQEQEELSRLGEDIQAGLSCNANGTGLPCRTDRLDAVSNMKRYLEIHNYTVIDKSRKPYRIMKSKSQREKNNVN